MTHFKVEIEAAYSSTDS